MISKKTLAACLLPLAVLFLVGCGDSDAEETTVQTADPVVTVQIVPSNENHAEMTAADALMNMTTGETTSVSVPVSAQSDTTQTEATENINVLSLGDAAGKRGDTVSVSLGIGGEVNFCAADMKIYYDSDKLKFIGFFDEDDDTLGNCKDDGVIFVNFLRIKNVADELRFCELNFEIITDETCSTVLRLEPAEVVALDSSDNIVYCMSSVKNGTLSLNGGGDGEQ